MMRHIFLTCILALLSSEVLFVQHLPRVAPEQVGLDSRQMLCADEAIQSAITKGEIPGAVLAVIRQGKMAYLKAYGYKRLYPYKEVMTANTIFDMASCSKSVSTAIAVMQLVERGKIRLLDPVDFYIPEFKNWESADGEQKTTTRVVDLMTHTSGLPPYAPVEELRQQYGSVNPEGLMQYISSCRRDFEPKTDFLYSCLNYIALQHIIELVSGEDLRSFARHHIFDVLGMQHTDYLPCKQNARGQWVTASLPSWAKVEKRKWHRLIAPTEQQPDGQVLCGQVHDPLARVLNGGISGNAGVFSCAEDLAVLCAALQNGGTWNGHRLLSPLTVKAMRTVPSATAAWGRTPGWDSYSPYASNNGDLFSPATYSHTGYTGTSIVIDPENDVSVILLINAVHPTDSHSVVRLRTLVSNVVAASLQTPTRVHTEHYYQRFLQFMDERPIGEEDIVMLGNSLTEGGGDWSQRLNHKHVINRGIIGDDLPGIYHRLHQILPGHPKKIFLMAGINDVSHGLPADSIILSLTEVLDCIRQQSPGTKVYLQSLLPIDESTGRYSRLAGKTDVVPLLNQALRRLASERGIVYIDLFPLFKQKNSNSLRPELSTDGLHLNELGYELWSKALLKHL